MSYNSNMLNDDILLILIFRYEPMVIILPHQSKIFIFLKFLYPIAFGPKSRGHSSSSILHIFSIFILRVIDSHISLLSKKPITNFLLQFCFSAFVKNIIHLVVRS